MAISTHEKINELIQSDKADSSIDATYRNAEREFKEIKKAYKQSKIEYKIAEEKLEVSRDGYRKAESFFEIIRARRTKKEAKNGLKLKKETHLLLKTKYKQKLQELRQLRREIREQYRRFKEYQIFFKRIQKAQSMGIQLPKYILDEYSRVDSLYYPQQYKIDKSGARSYLTKMNTSVSKDVIALISEQERSNVKNAINNTITKIKESFREREE